MRKRSRLTSSKLEKLFEQKLAKQGKRQVSWENASWKQLPVDPTEQKKA